MRQKHTRAREGGGRQLARGEVARLQCWWLYNKRMRVMAGRAEFEARDFSTGPLTSSVRSCHRLSTVMTVHFICATSANHLSSSLAGFVAKLASPWQNAPVLFFHIGNPDTLASSTVLLHCIQPCAAVILQLEHFIQFGLLSSLIPTWTNVQSLRILLGSSCDQRPYDRMEVLSHYVSPLLHVSFPTMERVTSLSITLRSEVNDLVRLHLV